MIDRHSGRRGVDVALAAPQPHQALVEHGSPAAPLDPRRDAQTPFKAEPGVELPRRLDVGVLAGHVAAVAGRAGEPGRHQPQTAGLAGAAAAAGEEAAERLPRVGVGGGYELVEGEVAQDVGRAIRKMLSTTA